MIVSANSKISGVGTMLTILQRPSER